MLDNGGEGSAATTASTPTAPGGVTLRAVRQVVTVWIDVEGSLLGPERQFDPRIASLPLDRLIPPGTG